MRPKLKSFNGCSEMWCLVFTAVLINAVKMVRINKRVRA